jgi:alpha,alpha-trehalase
MNNALFELHTFIRKNGRKLRGTLSVNVPATLKRLIEKEDTDGDKKITIEDTRIPDTARGERKFWIQTDRGMIEVSGSYYLSNLLQELKLLEEAGSEDAILSFERIFESPVNRISRLIRENYWDGLTRRIDEEGLISILRDEKATTRDGLHYLYVPPSDTRARAYYTSIAHNQSDSLFKVVELPRQVTASYVRGLDGFHGILSLSLRETPNGIIVGEPFVVPGGRFNEMYGWDSYFTILGLLTDGKQELAKSMVDNLIYEIEHYGQILNANRTYYLTRSQAPFLSSMILAVYDHLPKNGETRNWLTRTLNSAILEYENVWTNSHHGTKTGLTRYFDMGVGQPPEVEPGHFNAVYSHYARHHSMNVESFVQSYTSGNLGVPELDEYFIHDRAMRESGHDSSYRLVGQCADLVTVDLNSLLYKTEADIASIIRREFKGTFKTSTGRIERSQVWELRAATRRTQIDNYLWNRERGAFFDFNVRLQKQTGYISATTFYPLWAQLATPEQACSLVKNALPLLEMAGGIAGSTEESRGPISENRPPTQWDFPNGWAPHQILIWEGLQNYGYIEEAKRLAYRWLHTITSNAVNYNGVVPEKFDVVACSHHVDAEYGNVGTTFSYVTHEGFAWTNASYQLGLRVLSKKSIRKLNQLAP